ncbi:MAG: hypothetical protein LBB89_00705 [Treponema sp.]|nr:hypothetical protein [Treponema sp.]
MKKNFVLAAILALVLAGCGDGDGGGSSGNGNGGGNGKTFIRIKNESYSWLMNVHLQDKYFQPTVQNPYGNEGLPGDPGYFSQGNISYKIELTETTSGYIYFVLHIIARVADEIVVAARPCRTNSLVVVNIGEDVEFVFTDNTIVVDATDSTNVKTLKNMETYFIEGLTK